MHDAWNIALDGGTLSDVAEAWGTSKANVCKRLAERDRELREALRDNASIGRSLTPLAAKVRLRNVCAVGVTGAAEREGLATSSISSWMRRNAPFGAEDALEDYME